MIKACFAVIPVYFQNFTTILQLCYNTSIMQRKHILIQIHVCNELTFTNHTHYLTHLTSHQSLTLPASKIRVFADYGQTIF